MEKKIPWHITDLMLARLNDSVAEDESEELDRWINASEHHRILYQNWMEEERFQAFQTKSAEHDYLPRYAGLCRHITSVRRRRVLKRWGTAAAAVLIPLALFIWWHPWDENRLATNSDTSILPGQYRALLTLADGHTVALAQNSGLCGMKNIAAVLCEDTLSYEMTDSSVSGEYHLISIPRGGEYILKLSDGTRVWLNSETELRYPVCFSGPGRKVYFKGEAYFEVAHDSVHPFIVESGGQQLTVLGTSFAIRAYENEPAILTTLESGRVNIRSKGQQVVLTPGYQSRLAAGRLVVEKVNTSLYTAWHKGLFVFVDQPLGEILNNLSRWYNIEIFYTSPELEKLRFTGELQRYTDILEFLEKIEMLEKVRFTIRGQTVTVSGY